MTSLQLYQVAKNTKKKSPGCRTAAEYAGALGIEMRYSDLVNLKAMYSAASRFRTIFMNSRLGIHEQDFVGFHEIAHDQIPDHRRIARTGFMQDMAFFTPDVMRDVTEYQANAVAAHLYIDEEELMDYLLCDRRSLAETAQLLNAPPELVKIKLSEMRRLGRLPSADSGPAGLTPGDCGIILSCADLTADACFLSSLAFEEA